MISPLSQNALYPMQQKYALSRTQGSLGFAFLETLIALALCSIVAISLLSLQFKATQTTHQAYLNTKATTLLQDLAGRIRSNRHAALAGDYLFDKTHDKEINCIHKVCTPTQMAKFDHWQWQRHISASLPTPSYKIQFNKNRYELTLYWSNPMGDKSCHDKSIDDASISCTSLMVQL